MRIRIACGIGAAVVVLGVIFGFRIPSRVSSALQAQSEKTQQQMKKAAADQKAAEEAAAKKAAAATDKSKEATAEKAAAKKDSDKAAAAKKSKEKKAAAEKGATELIFTGNVLFNDATQENYDNDGVEGVVEKDLKKILASADIFELNHEFVLTSRGDAADKDPIYSIDPNYVKLETDMGVDVVALANDHFLDLGADGAADTLYSLNRCNIKHAGAGEKKKDAMAFTSIKKNGKRFGFVSATHMLPDPSWDIKESSPGVFSCEDPKALYKAIKNAKKSCDYVFALVHWGAEDTTDLEDYEGDMARAMIDAGADGVVGSHSHVVQTIDYYDGKPIFYGLGNFVFGDVIDETVAAKLNIDKKGGMKVSLIPAYAEGAQTKLASDEKATEIYDNIKKISPGIDISEDGEVTQK